jgi:hypothetical protein
MGETVSDQSLTESKALIGRALREIMKLCARSGNKLDATLDKVSEFGAGEHVL